MVDAKANLVSSIRFWLTCSPAQVRQTGYRAQAQKEALEEIREEDGNGVEQTPRQEEQDKMEADRRAQRGYAFIVRVNSVRPEEAETIDHPPAKARFTFAEGRCLQLLYVGQFHSWTWSEDAEAYLRLNTSEDEAHARKQMELYSKMHGPGSQ